MITKSEAATALREAEDVSRRTHTGNTYAKASPHLLSAGVIWALGYIGTGLTRPDQWVMIWVPLVILGVLFSLAITFRAHRPAIATSAAQVAHASHMLWMMAAITVFTACIFLLFRPSSLLPYLAFPALLMGLVYVMAGTFGLPRLRWIGLAIFAFTSAGLLLMPGQIAFWIAAVGGGGLILGGLWLRKA